MLETSQVLSWQRQPEAAQVARRTVEDALARCPEAAAFAQHMLDSAGVRIVDIIDAVGFADPAVQKRIEAAGWQRDGGGWRHPHARVPSFVADAGFTIWLRVESVERFLAANRIEAAVEGPAGGALRKARAFSATASRSA
jgi:hypothetical protein